MTLTDVKGMKSFASAAKAVNYFETLTVADTSQLAPFIWQPSLKLHVARRIILGEDVASAAIAMELHNFNVIAPKPSEDIDAVFRWSHPDTVDLMHEATEGEDGVADKLEAEVLGLAPGEASRSRWTFSDILLPGRYPLEKFANALHSSPDLLKQQLEHYKKLGRWVFLQTGAFFSQVSTETTEKGYVETGEIHLASQPGVEMARFILSMAEDNPKHNNISVPEIPTKVSSSS